jgi:hypothetical protein
MSSDSLPCLILEARYPKTNKRASIVFDFPEPLGPTIAEKDLRTSVIECQRHNGIYLVEWTNFLTAGIALEIDQRHLVNHKP